MSPSGKQSEIRETNNIAKDNKSDRKSRLWSKEIPNYQYFTSTKHVCKICKNFIKKELLEHIKTWWERQFILVALVASGHRTREEAKREYRVCAKNFRKRSHGGFFYICRDHIAHVGKCWLDILQIKSPDDVFSAHENGIRDAKIIMNFFGELEFKFKTEKAFLEHCDQFISYGWNELLKMFPELRESEEMGRRVVSLETTQVARSQAPNTVFHRTEGECDICGKLLTDGLELVEVWSRRILLYMLFKAKTIKRDRCKRIYNTTEHLVVCREHAKQAVEQVFETFGTQHPSQFLSMYQAPSYKPIINRMYEDLCRVYDLWYENRDTLVRAARKFVLSCEKDPVPNQTNCLKTPTYSTRSTQH
ncbi:hypothetical protein B9Z55_000801 [Caenorhabditis nigoni]|uniref:Lin-15A/B-like domain-containing protein n=1 Tax=Caenorhabditis nigoni TaxID=1611254 RepID=A0A2G5VUW8_9PELO|nr:hypothetical protein B9Z55_000801 [Caenorhabditis nigoni]